MSNKRGIPSYILAGTITIALIASAIHSDKLAANQGDTQQPEQTSNLVAPGETQSHIPETEEDTGFIKVGDKTFVSGFEAVTTDKTSKPGKDVASEYAILMNPTTGEIVCQKNAKKVINPASMTKILTVLVAAEHVKNLDDVVTIEREETDYCYMYDCSNAGLVEGDKLTVRELFYGTILPSGADAAIALAKYVAGSHEKFVEMMNEKVRELGLSETAHFTNCVGIYDKELHCTVYDMAMIMKAAVQNDFCREVLSCHCYTIPESENHPEGIVLSNWFLRRIEDHVEKSQVIAAKTGFVAQSGSCAASYGITNDGTPYICVTGKSYSSWGCIYDHIAMYDKYGE